MKALFLVVVLGFVFLCSCERDKSPFRPEAGYYFPLQVGNQWEYQRTFCTVNFRPLQGGTIFPNDTSRATITVRISKNIMLQDSISTFQLDEEYVGDGRSFADESYYANKQSGLYFYAYRNAMGSPMLPKEKAGAGIKFNGRPFQSIAEITRLLTHAAFEQAALDSLIYETPPLLCLKYPVSLDSRWAYRQAGPFRIDKRIIAQEEVAVPAGVFSCYKIQWLFDVNADRNWDDNILFFDDVCEKGLIRRSILYKNIQAVGDDLQPLGVYDASDEALLSKVEIN
jgi:hypothetical protein